MHMPNDDPERALIAYRERRDECSKLLAIAENIALLVASDDCFLESLVFEQLERDYKAQLEKAPSLSQ
jgi:hypothetical protein